MCVFVSVSVCAKANIPTTHQFIYPTQLLQLLLLLVVAMAAAANETQIPNKRKRAKGEQQKERARTRKKWAVCVCVCTARPEHTFFACLVSLFSLLHLCSWFMLH